VNTNPLLTETRANLLVMREYIDAAMARIDLLIAEPAPAPVPSVDEYVASATSATAVWKALEPELGVDRRTLLTRVERLVAAHGLVARFPNWSTDLKLAKYLAERTPSGKRRLVEALEALA